MEDHNNFKLKIMGLFKKKNKKGKYIKVVENGRTYYRKPEKK